MKYQKLITEKSPPDLIAAYQNNTALHSIVTNHEKRGSTYQAMLEDAVVELVAMVEAEPHNSLKMGVDALPLGKVIESGGGLQCCCPNCDYGSGTCSTFIEGMSKVVPATCQTCGTDYQTLIIEDLPRSFKEDW